MRDARGDAAVLKLLRLLSDHLEDFLEGGDLSFDTLGEVIEEGDYGADDIQAAIWVLRGFGGDFDVEVPASIEGLPGKRALRVWSAEERDSVSPEAWGYLIDLRRRGALDHDQFERVLDLLTTSGVRPVGLELAREVAARVALQVEDREGGAGTGHAEVDLAN